MRVNQPRSQKTYGVVYGNNRNNLMKLCHCKYFFWAASFVCLAIMASFLQACQPKSTNKNVAEGQQDSLETVNNKTSANPLITFWDNYNFQDLDAINDPEKGEQLFVDFIYRFPQYDLQTVKDAIHQMLDKAQTNQEVFAFFVAQYEKYLYDPNSPMRNDLYYEPVLVYLINSERLSSEERVKKETLLALVRKNQVGTSAADFDFVSINGQAGRLSDLSAPLTVLFFYEPGCSHCEQAIAVLGPDRRINTMIEDGSLIVLAAYPFGGRAIWKEYQRHLPSNWLNVFDEQEQVLKGQRYDLKATPTIFLLDREKRVLLKDVDVQQLLGYLQANVR